MKDAKVEQWLTMEGVEWGWLGAVPLAAVDHKRGLANQARFGAPLDGDVVGQIALAIQDGVDMPAIVVYHAKNGGLVPIDGNHRVGGALLAKQETIDAYEVVSEDTYVRDRLTRVANAVLNGRHLTLEEQIEHAKWLVRTYGRPVQDVAKEFHLNRQTVERALRVEETKERAQKMGVRADTIKTASVWERLHAIPNDHALAQAAKLVTETGMGTEQVNALVVDVRTAGTEAEQLAKVAEWSERPDIKHLKAETRGGRVRPQVTEREEVFRLTTSLIKLLQRCPTVGQLHITTAQDQERLNNNLVQLRVLMGRLSASVPREFSESAAPALSGR